MSGTRTRSWLRAYMVAVVLTAAGAILAAWQQRAPFPGWWPWGTFLVVATLLEVGLSTRLRVRGSGSISFVAHLSATLLFGVWWGACVGGGSMLIGSISRGNDPLKALFNVSQISLSIMLAAACYGFFGGQL